MVNIESVFLPQPVDKHDHYIQFPSESDQPCNVEQIKIDLEPCQQLASPHDQPSAFQIKIRMKMFKPLILPYLLHPYPLYYYEYLPLFSGENQVSGEKHLESFEYFVDRFQIIHEDVIMRYFSKYLIKDTATWFKSLRADSIGSYIKFSNAFVKYWGEYKSLDSYLADFYALKRERGEALSVFNRRFYSNYYDMPLDMHPTKIISMIYYVMGIHSKLSPLLLERKSSSLRSLFENDEDVEGNIHASTRI